MAEEANVSTEGHVVGEDTPDLPVIDQTEPTMSQEDLDAMVGTQMVRDGDPPDPLPAPAVSPEVQPEVQAEPVAELQPEPEPEVEPVTAEEPKLPEPSELPAAEEVTESENEMKIRRLTDLLEKMATGQPLIDEADLGEDAQPGQAAAQQQAQPPLTLEQIQQALIQQQAAQQGQQPQAQPSPAPTTAAASMEDLPFIKTDEEMTQVQTSKDMMNQKLSDVHYHTLQQVQQMVAQTIPSIVQQTVNDAMQAERFFQESEELRPYRQQVAVLGRNLKEMRPHLSTEQLLSVLKPLAMKKLGLANGAERVSSVPETTPTDNLVTKRTLASSHSSQPEATEPMTEEDKLMDDIDAMIRSNQTMRMDD